MKCLSQSLEHFFSHSRPEQFLKQNTISNSGGFWGVVTSVKSMESRGVNIHRREYLLRQTSKNDKSALFKFGFTFLFVDTAITINMYTTDTARC